MKIMILGSQGMLGHIVEKYFKLQAENKWQIITVARQNANFLIDVEQDLPYLEKTISITRPDYIINCIGLLNKYSIERPDRAIYLNAFFPHWLSRISQIYNSKLIHISTDCIFDGKRGNYSIEDFPTETNWYGKSKAWGELNNNKDLTIRTSIIGTELKSNGIGLLEWVLRQAGSINGYTNHWWNGITTLEYAKIIYEIINNNIILSGLHQITTPIKINKSCLVGLICKVWGKENEINPIVDKSILPNLTMDKTLISDLELSIPNYEIQLTELYNFTLKK